MSYTLQLSKEDVIDLASALTNQRVHGRRVNQVKDQSILGSRNITSAGDFLAKLASSYSILAIHLLLPLNL